MAQREVCPGGRGREYGAGHADYVVVFLTDWNVCHLRYVGFSSVCESALVRFFILVTSGDFVCGAVSTRGFASSVF